MTDAREVTFRLRVARREQEHFSMTLTGRTTLALSRGDLVAIGSSASLWRVTSTLHILGGTPPESTEIDLTFELLRPESLRAVYELREAARHLTRMGWLAVGKIEGETESDTSALRDSEFIDRFVNRPSP